MNYSPQIDSIAEFQVQTASVSAEYPRASINVVTKSGSNQLHGAAFEFLRNNDLDTRPFNLPATSRVPAQSVWRRNRRPDPEE